VTATEPELQNWAGGTWKSIKLIGMNSKLAKIAALFSTQRPLDDWLDALDYLAIGLVANKYTKLGKRSENLLLSQGLSYIKIPLCYSDFLYLALT
jgi:hypothetical protein